MKDFRIELRWAILFSFVTMLWMFAEYHLGWHDKHIANQLGYHFIMVFLIYLIMYYNAVKSKRKNYYDGAITWKQALVSGGTISVLVAILSPMTEFFIYHYISPEYFQNMIAYQTAAEHMSLESAENFFNMKSFIVQGIFTSLSMGFFVSLIVAFLAKRQPKEEEEVQSA